MGAGELADRGHARAGAQVLVVDARDRAAIWSASLSPPRGGSGCP
jgi:hypothetical protein